jgi:hypothetical protein
VGGDASINAECLVLCVTMQVMPQSRLLVLADVSALT